MTRVHARVGGQLTVRWVRDGSTTLVFPGADARVHALTGAEG
jgi:hypothetical protein